MRWQFDLRRSVVVAAARLSLCCAFAATLLPVACRSQQLTLTPDHASGIYDVGEKVGWTITAPDSKSTKPYEYSAKKNNQDVLKSGELDLSAGKGRIELSVSEPEMIYLEIKPSADGDGHPKPIVAGAAVAPTQLKPVAERPVDFDAFWAQKIASLESVPAHADLKPGDSGAENVDYSTITMDNFDGSHIHGQLARPKREGKFPAVVVFQWASPPYPLQKSWVTSLASQGWLALNIEPHDVLPDQPQSYYDALPDAIKHYESIGNNDRDHSYFLRMYLGDYRAVDYIAERPDWDGNTLLVMGTSMGGQQSLSVAGLHPKVTHLIVNVPAGCDTNGPLHGRQASYPFFPPNDPKIMETALYFDAVNFAQHIKAKSLVAMGFVDTISAPAGIWTAFDLISGEKEAVPMIDSPHNHQATPEQQRPYTERSAEWLASLVKGEPITPHQKLPTKAAAGAAPDDHQDMMLQLGIKALRPGANPKNDETFDEAAANQYHDSLPDALVMKSGKRVVSPEEWPARRAEIVEDFEHEIYGRIPADVPKVTWRVTSSASGKEGDRPTLTKELVGDVDNSACPQIEVNLHATFTVPTEMDSAVPMMIVFTRPIRGQLFAGRPGAAISLPDEAIKHGWGYALLDTESIQPDNAAGLRTGIIGLANHGIARKPDEWGSLRAWQWGASRLIDYFESNADAQVDAKKVGIEGVSRYGKAALVTQAFDPRVAVGLIASSGEGGAKLFRHVYGETVENLAGGEFYWMAGNFLKYATSDSSFGAKSTADLPVDSHELIALCAPRPCFISYGTVEGGDPKWIDARGSYMAGVLSGSVYHLLGKKGFGSASDYLTDAVPPVGQLVGGELAWRQHEGGHDVTPNWPSFFEWADRYVKSPAKTEATPSTNTSGRNERVKSTNANSIEQPSERTDANSRIAHQQLLQKAGHGGIDVYFVGDSITRRWGCSDLQYAELLANWQHNFFGWNAGNFGWGGDTIQNILWRLNNGELDGVDPKVIVILAGTNNINPQTAGDAATESIARGIHAILDVCRAKAPHATIVITAIFPRDDKPGVMPTIQHINEKIAKFAVGDHVRFLNVNSSMTGADGKLLNGVMRDGLHPTLEGYQIWADGLRPILIELLGPPAASDHGPPPTGDPSVAPSVK